MQSGVDAIVAAVRDNPAAGVKVHYVPFPREGHGTIYQPAAMQALRTLFTVREQSKNEQE